MRPAVPCRLEVRLPPTAGPSRDFVLDFTPTDDPNLLAGMSAEMAYSNTVNGLSQSSSASVSPIGGRPATLVLGPVDLFSPLQPARASLIACTVAGQIHATPAARPQDKELSGAGLGVHYSDNRNHCVVRIRAADVAVVQTRDGKRTTLKTWPLTDPAATRFDLALTIQGPQLTVRLDGAALGSVMLDQIGRASCRERV